MPGFLIFEEFSIDPDMPGAGMAKAALGNLPGSWMLHGLGGEFNVDVDPVAELREMSQGGGSLARAAGGNITEFWEAYKGWIAVKNVTHNIPGVAKTDEQRAQEHANRIHQRSDHLLEDVKRMMLGGFRAHEAAPDSVEAALNDGQKVALSNMNTGGVNTVSVEVEIDVSLPKLIEAALDGKEFGSADVHMCTTAQIDVSQLTLGSDNPAASLIQTLIGAMLFNIIPYFTISMRSVTIRDVNLNISAEDAVPSASVDLTFKKVIWTYHVINASNMNLFNVSFEYDTTKREKETDMSLGSMLNPFG